MKHIDTECNFIREKVAVGPILLEFKLLINSKHSNQRLYPHLNFQPFFLRWKCWHFIFYLEKEYYSFMLSFYFIEDIEYSFSFYSMPTFSRAGRDGACNWSIRIMRYNLRLGPLMGVGRSAQCWTSEEDKSRTPSRPTTKKKKKKNRHSHLGCKLSTVTNPYFYSVIF